MLAPQPKSCLLLELPVRGDLRAIELLQHVENALEKHELCSEHWDHCAYDRALRSTATTWWRAFGLPSKPYLGKTTLLSAGGGKRPDKDACTLEPRES